MTKALPHGTRNLAINLDDDNWLAITMRSFANGESKSRFFWKNFIRGVALTDPEAAKRMARIKRDRLRATAMLALTVIALFCGSEMRRPRSMAAARKARQEEAAC